MLNKENEEEKRGENRREERRREERRGEKRRGEVHKDRQISFVFQKMEALMVCCFCFF